MECFYAQTNNEKRYSPNNLCLPNCQHMPDHYKSYKVPAQLTGLLLIMLLCTQQPASYWPSTYLYGS
jgi:hypothetical protein